MTLPINSIYQTIGTEIAKSIPEEWDKAWVVFEFSPDVFDIRGRYISADTKQEKSFVVSQNTITHLHNLHIQMAETPKGDWKTARFELQRNGQFELHFEY